MKNVCKLSPKRRNYSNLMYCTQGRGLGWLGGWVGVVLNLSKSCRLLGVSNVYASWGGRCFQLDTLCSCPSLLAHATHIQEWWKCGWASNHEIPGCVVDVLWMKQVKQRLSSPLHCSFCMLNKCKTLKWNSFFGGAGSKLPLKCAKMQNNSSRNWDKKKKSFYPNWGEN